MSVCDYCKGKGEIKRPSSRALFGVRYVRCPDCRGTGRKLQREPRSVRGPHRPGSVR